MQAVFRATKVVPFMLHVRATGPSRAFAQTSRTSITSPPRAHLSAGGAPFSTVVYRVEGLNSREFKFDETQVYGREVKANPSESEADVAADRGEIDPLPMGMHHIILLDAGETIKWTAPTDSEAAVHADKYMDDPMRKAGGYC